MIIFSLFQNYRSPCEFVRMHFSLMNNIIAVKTRNRTNQARTNKKCRSVSANNRKNYC